MVVVVIVTGCHLSTISLTDKYKVPAGTHIVLGVMEMQRDRTIWGPKCNEFNPDTFLPENFEKIHPYAYIPFRYLVDLLIFHHFFNSPLPINFPVLVPATA